MIPGITKRFCGVPILLIAWYAVLWILTVALAEDLYSECGNYEKMHASRACCAYACLLRLSAKLYPLSAAPCHNVMSILNHLALLQPGFTAALALLKQALCRDKSALMMKSMVVPKKGRGRQVLKRPKCKNPPKQKAEKVKYVRIAQNSAQNKRMDQTKWRRSLPELLAATDLGIIRLLQKDKILPEWAGHKCPRCSKGTLSPLLPRPGRTTYAYRCGAKGCQCYVNPQHLHPLFVEYSGGQEGQGHSLQTQAGLLLLTLNNINHASIHRLLHINHKAIEDFNRRLHHVRQKYVETHEKKIIFGADANWVDVEADEATFDRCDMSSVDPTKVKGKSCILWEQWCGLVERGRPESLVLHRLKGRGQFEKLSGARWRRSIWSTARSSSIRTRPGPINSSWKMCTMTT